VEESDERLGEEAAMLARRIVAVTGEGAVAALENTNGGLWPRLLGAGLWDRRNMGSTARDACEDGARKRETAFL
jgi:hypothetical protein